MKKSPYKQADSRQIYREQKTGGMQKMLDPAGVFAPDQVKSIMTEGDKSAFKMKGFPQHTGISPLKQSITDIYRRNKKKDPVFVESPRHEKKLLKRIYEKKIEARKANKIKQSFKDFISEYSPSEGGYKGEIGKAVISMSTEKLLAKKEEKKPVGILSKEWKKIM